VHIQIPRGEVILAMPAATQEPAPSGLDAKARRQFSALSTSRLPRGLGEFAARVAGSVSELTRVATLARLTRKQRARGTGEHDTVIAWLSEARQMPAENWRDFRQPTDIPYIEQARNWFTAMWDTISYEYPA
jgi:hypothetical protein